MRISLGGAWAWGVMALLAASPPASVEAQTAETAIATFNTNTLSILGTAGADDIVVSADLNGHIQVIRDGEVVPTHSPTSIPRRATSS
jgi:hypothetical protein